MNETNVIISGVSGQDGSFMAEYLLKNTNYNIIGTMRRTSQPIMSNIQSCLANDRFFIYPMDLTDVHSITNLIQQIKPDYFINLGGQTYVADSWNSPENFLTTNSISIIHILETIRKYCPTCRVYSAGSSEQFGNVLYTPQDEKHPFRPRSPYGVSKCTAHNLIKVYRESYNLYAVQGIVFNHESIRRQEYFITRKITKSVGRIYNAIKNGQKFDPLEIGNVNSKRDWSAAEDCVDAIWKMLNQDKIISDTCSLVVDTLENGERTNFIPKEYVVASGEMHSVREFIEKSFEIVGIQGNWIGDGADEIFENKHYGILVKINPIYYRPAEIEALCGDSSLIRKELGWSPQINFDQLVKKMVENDMNYPSAKADGFSAPSEIKRPST